MREASGAVRPLLEVRGLYSGYGDTPVLRGVDLEVWPGEVVAVAGRNGTGKSTLMKALIGLLPCTAGTIVFAGTPVEQLPAFRRARLGIGYVPQGREVFPRMTVEENIVAGGIARGRGAAGLGRLLGHFPALAERRRQKAGTLSGGQQQQLAIARALACDPSLLMMDEPSEGIQPNVVQEIARIIRRLAADTGLAILLVEQNVALIEAVGRRFHRMEKGRMTALADRSALVEAETGLRP